VNVRLVNVRLVNVRLVNVRLVNVRLVNVRLMLSASIFNSAKNQFAVIPQVVSSN